MYEPDAHRILEMIRDNDLVLDIEGWARPFNRANSSWIKSPLRLGAHTSCSRWLDRIV